MEVNKIVTLIDNIPEPLIPLKDSRLTEADIWKLLEDKDIAPMIGNIYPARKGYIASATGQWVSSNNYGHWVIPVDYARKVVLTANPHTDSYYTFFSAYTSGTQIPTTSYATGYTSIKQVIAGETEAIVVPPDAKWMYLNTGNQGAAFPSSVKVTGICVTERKGTSSQFVKGDGTLDSNQYLTEQLPADWNANTGPQRILNKPQIPDNDILLYKMSAYEIHDGITQGCYVEGVAEITNKIDAARQAGKLVMLSINFGTETAAVLQMPAVQFNPMYSFNGSVVYNGRLYTIFVYPRTENGDYVYENIGGTNVLLWNVEMNSIAINQTTQYEELSVSITNNALSILNLPEIQVISQAIQSKKTIRCKLTNNDHNFSFYLYPYCARVVDGAHHVEFYGYEHSYSTSTMTIVQLTGSGNSGTRGVWMLMKSTIAKEQYL